MHVAWLGLGSNLDAPAEQVRQACADIAATRGLGLLAVSRRYRTAPVGGPTGQPDYCNACVAIATACSPLNLLDVLQGIERAYGRRRDIRWGPRTLDLDLLAYDDRVLDHPRLQLPHPRAHERAFVLVPLAEIAPALTLGPYGRVIDCLAAIGRTGVVPWTS